jgi:hypothetical protein
MKQTIKVFFGNFSKIDWVIFIMVIASFGLTLTFTSCTPQEECACYIVVPTGTRGLNPNQGTGEPRPVAPTERQYVGSDCSKDGTLTYRPVGSGMMALKISCTLE